MSVERRVNVWRRRGGTVYMLGEDGRNKVCVGGRRVCACVG